MEPTDPLIEKIRKSDLGAHLRPTCVPVVEDGDGAPDASKFGGTPYLAEGEAWPACPHCKHPMPLVLQIDLSTLPPELGARFGKGLLQFFYCTNGDPLCEVETEAFFGGGTRSKLTRIVYPKAGSRAVDAPPMPRPLTPKRITGWQLRLEPPPAVELLHRGLDYDAMLAAAGIDEDTYIDAIEIDDKLGGWPAWIQNVEYPKCPDCAAEMNSFVFQITSDQSVDCTFCGDGVAYVVQCPAHPERVDEVAQR